MARKPRPRQAAPLDQALRVFRRAERNGPYARRLDAKPVHAAYVAFAHALADFVDVSRANGTVGYAGALEKVAGLVTMLPAPERFTLPEEFEEMPLADEVEYGEGAA